MINPWFLGAFIGTALLSLGVLVQAVFDDSHRSTMFLLGGATFYLVGTFLVTIFANIPLNDQLATVSATDTDAIKFWTLYLNRWTIWNHVRTVAAMSAALLYALALMKK